MNDIGRKFPGTGKKCFKEKTVNCISNSVVKSSDLWSKKIAIATRSRVAVTLWNDSNFSGVMGQRPI